MAALAIEYQPLTTILLYGKLRQFGRSFRLSVRTPAEAIKALCVQVPGFERFMANAKSEGLEFAIFRGTRNLDEKELGFGGSGDIRIAPVISGSKRAGLLQTIIGVAIVALAWWNPLDGPPRRRWPWAWAVAPWPWEESSRCSVHRPRGSL